MLEDVKGHISIMLTASEVDIMGVSFYPFYDSGATLNNLRSSLTNLANNYRKPIVVAETDWPVTCSGVALTEPSIPVSVQGQEEWTGDIKSVLTSLPNGLGQGICEHLEAFAGLARGGLTRIVDYWEPGWVGNAALGSSCSVGCHI